MRVYSHFQGPFGWSRPMSLRATQASLLNCNWFYKQVIPPGAAARRNYLFVKPVAVQQRGLRRAERHWAAPTKRALEMAIDSHQRCPLSAKPFVRTSSVLPIGNWKTEK